MTNRSAPLACLSPREQARRLAALYPSEAVRWHMLETLTNLQDYAAMRGAHGRLVRLGQARGRRAYLARGRRAGIDVKASAAARPLRVALGLNGRHRGAQPAAGPLLELPAALAPPADPWPGAPLDPWALVPGI